ncbi:MAG: hypothetical protein J1E82_08275 [Muribaculaceae bacterium]|nr:hypothetical protein [Muribaculaceae bacterium]
MTSENDSLKKLFDDFNPELSDDRQFMDRLVAGIDAVDLFKVSERRRARRLRIVAAVSALAGFFCGVILTLLFPVLVDFLYPFIINISNFSPDTQLLTNSIVWCLVAIASLSTTFTTFSLMASLPLKK